MQRMEERAHLPAAEMPGEEEHALAALLRRLEILKALVHRDRGGVLASVVGKQADLAEQTAERDVNPAQDLAALLDGFFREGQLEIAHAHAPQPRVQVVHQAADQDADALRQTAGQDAN